MTIDELRAQRDAAWAAYEKANARLRARSEHIEYLVEEQSAMYAFARAYRAWWEAAPAAPRTILVGEPLIYLDDLAPRVPPVSERTVATKTGPETDIGELDELAEEVRFDAALAPDEEDEWAELSRGVCDES